MSFLSSIVKHIRIYSTYLLLIGLYFVIISIDARNKGTKTPVNNKVIDINKSHHDNSYINYNKTRIIIPVIPYKD